VPTQLRGLRVLVVDDNRTNRLILEETLLHWGMRPTVVESGGEALSAMRQAHQLKQPYALILSDAMMPAMDGITLARHIRENHDWNETPIIMLTSAGEPENADEVRDAGISRCLTKPIKGPDLLDAMRQVLTAWPAEQPVHASTEASPHTNTSRRVLVAEDGVVNQKVALNLLQRRGHEVVLVENGKQAVAAVAEGDFDVVLMDVEMPEMDGIEATYAIREREQHTGQRIPIIAVTAHAMKGDRERFLEAGMDGYIAKPLEVNQLYEAVEGIPTAKKDDA
jgi:CheY-like chemotaxis protein